MGGRRGRSRGKAQQKQRERPRNRIEEEEEGADYLGKEERRRYRDGRKKKERESCKWTWKDSWKIPSRLLWAHNFFHSSAQKYRIKSAKTG